MTKVGDIVKTKNKEQKIVLPAVVTRVYIKNDYSTNHEDEVYAVEVLFADGTYGYRGKGKYETTYRSIDIQSILDQIK